MGFLFDFEWLCQFNPLGLLHLMELKNLVVIWHFHFSNWWRVKHKWLLHITHCCCVNHWRFLVCHSCSWLSKVIYLIKNHQKVCMSIFKKYYSLAFFITFYGMIFYHYYSFFGIVILWRIWLQAHLFDYVSLFVWPSDLFAQLL